MTPSKHLITVIGLLAECLCISALFVWGFFFVMLSCLSASCQLCVSFTHLYALLGGI